ncbi:TPA: hypothetical protein DDW35_09995 [Candidatus Sumerlaeota bacterium]|nr:hypothetical protein [Candidatus Sumerlaeota bacterium]
MRISPINTALCYCLFLLCVLSGARVFAQNRLPEITAKELADIVRNDYTKINTLVIDFDKIRVEASKDDDPGMWAHRIFSVKREKALKEEESGIVASNGTKQAQFGEMRSWDGKTQRVYAAETHSGVITEETESHLILDNAYLTLAAIKPSEDTGTVSNKPSHLINGTFLEYLDTGQIAIKGEETINGHLCYKLGWDEATAKTPMPERLFWVAPDLGYTPIKESLVLKEDPAHPSYIVEVLDQKKIDGFMRYWPTKGKMTWFFINPDKSYRKIVDEILVNDLRLNVDLPDSTFQVSFPPDTRVTDRIMGVSYVVPGGKQESGGLTSQEIVNGAELKKNIVSKLDTSVRVDEKPLDTKLSQKPSGQNKNNPNLTIGNNSTTSPFGRWFPLIIVFIVVGFYIIFKLYLQRR